MKHSYLLILLLLVSCKVDNTISESELKAFQSMSQTYQTTYLNGGDHCEDILLAMSEKIEMWENGKVWTYTDPVSYTHLRAHET